MNPVMKPLLKPKILCLDDEPGILAALDRTLRDEFEVLTSKNPKEALLLAQLHADCSVILTDYKMPEMNGIEFLRQVQNILPFATRAILSAEIDLFKVSEAINTSVIHKFFMKPWENEYLKIQMLAAHKMHATIWLSTNDSVTDLHNHRFFQERLTAEVALAVANQGTLGLLMIDVDHFKTFNDRFGHPEGDKLLRALSTKLRQFTPAHAFACRYGGEEFGIILPGTSPEELMITAEAIRKTVELEPVPGLTTRTCYVTVSIGAACLPSHASTKEELIRVADRALFQAKRQGRNQSVSASPKSSDTISS
jgi:diguanylate cyclase (GGDEF)-like protein